MGDFIKIYKNTLFFLFVSICFSSIIIDDFDDGVIDDTLWSVQQTTNTNIVEVGGFLRERINWGGCGGLRVCYATLRTKKCVVGDFDAHIRFDIRDFRDGDITTLMLIASNDCFRQRVSLSWATYYDFFSYRAEFIDSVESDTIWRIIDSDFTSDAEGALRLQRIGNVFYFNYEIPFLGWAIIDSFEIDMPKVWLAIHVQNQGTHELIDAAVDSFYLEYDRLSWSKCTPPEPTPGCMNDKILIEISDLEGVFAPSIDITVDGIHYDIRSHMVDFSVDELLFTPAVPWLDGSTHEVCLLHVEDSVGNAFLDTVCWTFITDLNPPIVGDFIPAPGDTIPTDSPVISARIMDAFHRIDTDNSYITINRLRFAFRHPVMVWDSLTGIFRFDTESLGFHYPTGDIVRVCVYTSDYIINCPSNDTTICWEFLIDIDVIAENHITNPTQFEITVNPNPFNTSCQITAPAGSQIEIFDIAGHKVQGVLLPSTGSGSGSVSSPSLIEEGLGWLSPSLIEERQGAVWSPSPETPSGVYLVRVKVDDSKYINRRIVLIR